MSLGTKCFNVIGKRQEFVPILPALVCASEKNPKQYVPDLLITWIVLAFDDYTPDALWVVFRILFYQPNAPSLPPQLHYLSL